MYRSRLINSDNKKEQLFEHGVGKVVCVGRNYREHAKELNNPIPNSPVLFIKPGSCVVDLEKTLHIPSHPASSCHHELELTLLIGKAMSQIKPDNVLSSIAGFGLGLDLTLRELQSELKSKGHPWEKAKAFDGACPVSKFVAYDQNCDLLNMIFALQKNGLSVQQGNSNQMIFPIEELVAEISNHFTLLPGDIIMTGTPAGVAPLKSSDHLVFYLDGKVFAESCVV